MKTHFSYEEQSADGWKIDVKKDGTHVGFIIKNPNDGSYQFYLGDNYLSLSLENPQLDLLKKKIEKSPAL